MVFVPKAWRDIPDRSTPINAAALIDMETRLGAYADTGDAAGRVYADAGDTSARAYTDVQVATRAALAHAATHQDGGADPLTVREAMMATGAVGLAKGAFNAFRTAALSLGTTAGVVFDTDTGVGYDVSNWYDTTTGRYTPQVPGYYDFKWGVGASGTLTVDNWWMSQLFVNGVADKEGQIIFQRAAVGLRSMGQAQVKMNGTTDFVDVRINHNQGAAVALLTGASSTFFQGHLFGRS
jgi:hypothetical protein